MLKLIKNFKCYIYLLVPAVIFFFVNYHTALQLASKEYAVTIGDQNAIYHAFMELLRNEVPQAIKSGWMPVGYLALINFYHELANLFSFSSAYESFIFHNLFYSCISIFVSNLMIFRLVKASYSGFSQEYLAVFSSLYWIACCYFGTLFKFEWLTWSHHASAAAGIMFFWTFVETLIKSSVLKTGLLTLFGTLFMYTRRHEFYALALSFVIIFVIKELLRGQILKQKTDAIAIGFGIFLGVFSSLAFIKYFSNNQELNNHYYQQAETNTFVKEYLKVKPQTIPVRFVQSFIDPDYFSYNNAFHHKDKLSKMSDFLIFLGYQNKDDGLSSIPSFFGLPLIFQIPNFLPFLLCSIICFFFFLYKKGFKSLFSDFKLLTLLVGLSAVLTITCGYLSTAVWSGVHLKNGLVREFKLSYMILVIVFSVPFSHILLVNKNTSFRSLKMLLFTLGLIFFPLIQTTALVKNYEMLEFKKYHLNSLSGNYSCNKVKCFIKIDNLTSKYTNQEIEAPFSYVISNQICDAQQGSLHEYGTTHSSFDFILTLRDCSGPINVEIYPLITGYCGSGNPSIKFTVYK